MVGSEVPNLLEPGAASTLVVSQDVDVGVLVTEHRSVKARLDRIHGFRPAPEEPSVWLPESPEMIEVNFLGIDPARAVGDAYMVEDDVLPLMVFGALSLVRPGEVLDLDGVRVRLPRPAGMLLEKLVTDRTGEKGDRDLLVALGVIQTASAADIEEALAEFRRLSSEVRHSVRSNLTLLSLLAPRAGMPDPRPERARVAALLARLDDEAAG